MKKKCKLCNEEFEAYSTFVHCSEICRDKDKVLQLNEKWLNRESKSKMSSEVNKKRGYRIGNTHV